MITKKEIRRQIISQRKLMDAKDYWYKSDQVSKSIMKHPIYKKSNVIYCYSSINNELSLDLLMEDVVRQKKMLVLPKVEEDNLTFYKVDNVDALEKGYFNILEPINCIIAPSPDLILVPGVAFTLEGLRLGYGGGFYDRYLHNTSAYSIGVGFDFQIFKHLPTEKHDMVLNEIIFA